MSNTIYEQAGIAAFLAGMRRASEILTTEIEHLERRLVALRQPAPSPWGPPDVEVRPDPPEPHSEADLAVINAIQQRKKYRISAAARQAKAEHMRQGRANGTIQPRREAEAKAKANEPRAKKDAKALRMVGPGYTVYGLAHKLDMSSYQVRRRLDESKVKGKRVPHPVNKGARIDVFPMAVLQKLRKSLDKPRPKAGQHLPNHPRNPGHPKHDEWRELMSKAQSARIARLKAEQANGSAAA